MNNPFDPVTLEILWSRLISVVDEMATILMRTSFSTVIGAANDFGCEVMDSHGRSLAHATRSMPVFNQTLPQVTKAIIDRFGAETMQPGDVFITNDPWLCAGHHPDIAVMTPFFQGQQLIGFAASIAHATDMGGTLDFNHVRECFEEGLLIPPARLYAAGELNELVLDFVRHNVRVADMVIGDIHAQVAANEVGGLKVLALLDEYDLDDLEALSAEIQGRTYQAMRAAISALPNGVYRSEIEFNELDEPQRIRVQVTVEGDHLKVDYTGSSAQHEAGGINCTLTYTRGHTAYALKCALIPEVPDNEGCYTAIAMTAPEGSILNARFPASVGMRTKTGWYLGVALYEALADALPQRVQAAGGLMMGLKAYGFDADGQPFNAWLFNGGGMGGSASTDGLSTMIYPSSASNVPVELFEVAAPLLVHEKALLPNSGGSGRHRGGLGQRLTISRLPGFDRPAIVSVWPHRYITPASGLLGGQPGRPAQVHVNGRRLSPEEIAAETGQVVFRDDHLMLTVDSAGGGGFGPPEARDPEAIRQDVEAGFVVAPPRSPEASGDS